MSLGNIVVINKKTGDMVPYRIDPHNKSIIIVSTNPADDDESCMVTTWDEITEKNIKKGCKIND